MNLFSAVYCISVYLLVYSNANDIQEIDIIGPNPQHAYFVVQEHEPLQITVENFTTVLRCTYSEYKNAYSSFYNYNFRTASYRIMIPEVTAHMNARWLCEVIDLNNTHRNHTFDIRVKGSKRVQMQIGGVSEIYNKTNLSVLEYDGIARHEYEEGYIVDLICGNVYATGQVRLRYYDAKDRIIVETHGNGTKVPLRFRMLIKDKKVNGSYVDCTYILPITKQEFTYRTIFGVLSNENIESTNELLVTINDAEIPVLLLNGGKSKYLYYFSWEESIKLACSKRTPVPLGNIYAKIKNNNTEIVNTDIVNTSSIYSTVLKTSNLDGIIFQCYTIVEKTIITADIMFKEELSLDPVVRGLPSNNIIYQYNTGNGPLVIHYQYTMDELLNLTCISSIYRQPVWIYRKNIVQTVYDTKKYKYLNHLFQMDASVNDTLTCESTTSGNRPRRVIVVLSKLQNVTGPLNAVADITIIFIGVLLICVLITSLLVDKYYFKKVTKIRPTEDITLMTAYKYEEKNANGVTNKA